MSWFRKIKVRLTVAEMVLHFGPQCEDYAKGCAVCDAWREFNKGDWVSVLVDRDEFTRVLKGA